MIFTAILSIIAILLSATSIWLWRQDHLRFSAFFENGKSFDLEKELRRHQARQHELKQLADSIKSSQAQITELQNKALQKYSVVRFNPFRDTGGNQSFCLCMLDLKDNGIIITAIHGRDGTRIYSKTIDSGLSQHELSTEEAKALHEAKHN